MHEAQKIVSGCTGQLQDAMVRVLDLDCNFDVSPPFLNRLVQHRGRQILKAVDGVSFDITKGKTFSLVGESGCGKSTVAKLLVGLHSPTSGSMFFEGFDLARQKDRSKIPYIQSKMQMIFQDSFASLNPRWRVSDIIAEPIRTHGVSSDRKSVRERVDMLLRQVGLSPADGKLYPHEFSGGQRQRISIARAIAVNPQFLICDEPTSALDVSVQAQILNLLKDIQQKFNLTYLFISHDLAVVYHVSDFVGVMYLGRIVESAERNILFNNPRHPYTRMLLDAVPDLEMTGRTRTPIAGEVASPIKRPSGCHFHPRCPFADRRCRDERPEVIMQDGTRVACHGVEENRLPPFRSGNISL